MADLTRRSKNPRAARGHLTKCHLPSSPRCVSSCCRPAGRRRRCASPARRCASNAARTGSARNRPRPPHPRPTRPPRHPPAVSGPLRISWCTCPGTARPQRRSTAGSSTRPPRNPAPSSTTGSRRPRFPTPPQGPQCSGSTVAPAPAPSSASCKRTDRSSSIAPEDSCVTHGRGPNRRTYSRWSPQRASGTPTAKPRWAADPAPTPTTQPRQLRSRPWWTFSKTNSRHSRITRFTSPASPTPAFTCPHWRGGSWTTTIRTIRSRLTSRA